MQGYTEEQEPEATSSWWMRSLSLPFPLALWTGKFSWLCRATPDLHKGNMNSRQSLSCRSFPPLPLIAQKSVYKHTKSAYSPVTTTHAITGRETQTRSTATHHLMGQIQYCNFIQTKAAVSRLCQDVFKQKKHCKQIKVVCNRIGQKVP